MNQTEKSGSSFMAYGRKTLSMLALGLSLFLMGSCNESATIFSEPHKPVNLGELSKDDLIRYGYKIQAALTYKPDDLRQLRRADLKLALAKPDLNRKEGNKNVWQYRTASCVLDVYWQKNRPQATISHYEFRERRSIFDKASAANDPAAWHCMQSLIEQRREVVQKSFEEAYADLSLNAHKS